MKSLRLLPRWRSPDRPARRVARAFTLVELLVVILIIMVLLGLTLPLARSVFGGRNISDSLDAVSDYLSYARTQAMTQNTYTVVGFYQAKGSDDLQLGSVSSVTGLFDVSQFAASPPVYNKNYPPLGRIVHVPNVTFVSEPNLSSALKARLVNAQIEAGISDGSILDCLGTTQNNASILSFLSGKTSFGKGATGAAFPACVIVFSPQGEALYFSQASFQNYPTTTSTKFPFYGQLFIGLRSTRGGAVVPTDQNSAALTLDGGSGSIKTYRL